MFSLWANLAAWNNQDQN